MHTSTEGYGVHPDAVDGGRGGRDGPQLRAGRFRAGRDERQSVRGGPQGLDHPLLGHNHKQAA
eukprot:scaffold35007_cov36-Prasinocladus_malaysianus.AAC.1